MKILIVDDDLGFRELMRTMLLKFSDSFYKFEIFEATSLETASITIAETLPDIVLFDLFLPDAQLHESYHFIEANKTASYIVAVSNTDRQDVVVASITAGAKDFVSKRTILDPVSLKEKIEKICDILQTTTQDDRKLNISSESLDLAKHNMSDEEFKKMLEYFHWSQYNVSRLLITVDKIHKTVYESNGSPSLKEEVNTLKREVQELKKKLDESTNVAGEEEGDKKGGMFWTGLFGFLGVIATILGGILIKIFAH